jgi:hypothetical protein
VPLFSPEEAAQVIANAEAEGVDKNEFKSGKYQLAGKLGIVLVTLSTVRKDQSLTWIHNVTLV